LNIKPNDIKNNIFLFINSKIENPTFDEQSKETLTSKINSGAPTLSEKLIKQFSNSQIIEDLIKFLNIKEQVDTKKEIGKHKIKISKLDDAKKAGTSESCKCKMIFCEGDSAVNSVIAGLSNVDSSYWGIFPLRGKVANPREVNLQKVRENEEIKNIINILGLEYGKKYTDLSKLRYGKIILFADSDPDGNHIRGLLINLFDVFWPELLRMDFIYDFVTPIIKIKKSGKVKYFYNLMDYVKEKNNLKDWDVKWLKGLASLEPDEMKMFFKNVNKHLIRYNYNDKADNRDLIDMAFNKKRSDDRKEWMKNYNPDVYIDKFTEKQTYDKFINNELMEFSMVDNNRMIPNIVDGFKPVQRKILYIFHEDKIKGEIKVSSLSGSIIKRLAYHNGDASCNQAIVGMAQNFVGSNNINLLLPVGNFGSRLKGGNDSGSPRYIFTQLNDITNLIFRKEDYDILSYNDDDGSPIEPYYFMPIIPMILVNGADGIGFGYSTNIPSFNPNDIIIYLQNKIKNKKNIELLPYYKDFKGEIIIDIENKRYISRGILNKVNEYCYDIKELPIWTWNDKYYEYLDELMEDKKDDKGKVTRKALIKDWSKNRNDKNVDIRIFFRKDVEIQDVYKILKMETYIPMSNLHLFDQNKKIKKYADQYEIIDDFYTIRMEYYTKRKNYQLDELKKDIRIHQNRMKFLKLVIDGDIVINKRTRDLVEINLEKHKLERFEESYGYLLNMSIMSFTKDRLQELKDEYDKLKEKLKKLETTSESSIWLSELQELKSKIK
jgi:DNA topoisomerase-2